MIKTNMCKMLVSSLLLSACTPLLGTVTPPTSTTGSRSMQKSQQISGYLMHVAATFKTQAIQASHAPLIQENILAFEDDLSQGRLDDYYQLPDFSIQLLAHSEGSYFTSPDNLNEFTNSNAAFARALVIYPDQSYDIFKGQFANQRFYFSGAESLPTNNTSYLITLDQDLKPRVVSGQLQGQSASATPLPSASPVVLPAPSVLALPTPSSSPSPTVSASAFPTGSPRPPAAQPPEQRFSPALAQYRQRAGAFNQQIRGFLPGPPPPPPPQARGQFAPPPGAPPLPRDQQPGNSVAGGQIPPGPPPALFPPEVMERLRRERPAVLAEIQALAGLPPQEHYAAMQKIQARNADVIPELGPPPPPSEASPQP